MRISTLLLFIIGYATANPSVAGEDRYLEVEVVKELSVSDFYNSAEKTPIVFTHFPALRYFEYDMPYALKRKGQKVAVGFVLFMSRGLSEKPVVVRVLANDYANVIRFSETSNVSDEEILYIYELEFRQLKCKEFPCREEKIKFEIGKNEVTYQGRAVGVFE